MSLGAGETTLMRLTTAYAMIVNGGKKITPIIIDRVQDRRGKTILKNDLRSCANCKLDNYKEGNELGLEIYKDAKFVDVRSKTIGKGFSGLQKRHNFTRGPMTHGSKNHRLPGSIGAGSTPGLNMPYLDTPNTTSQVTYNVRARIQSGHHFNMGVNDVPTNITAMEYST